MSKINFSLSIQLFFVKRDFCILCFYFLKSCYNVNGMSVVLKEEFVRTGGITAYT